jgi:hypothetical protein
MTPQDKPPVIQKPPPVPAQRPVPVVKGSAPAARTNQINIWELLFRLFTFSLLAASVMIAWWMFSQRLVPRQKQSRELGSRVSRFSIEVDELERQWSEAEAQRVSNKYALVRSNLFVGPAALEAWWINLKEQAIPLTLDLRVEFGAAKPKLTNQENIALVPTTLALEVQPAVGTERPESPYQRVLRLAHRLTTGDKRADLAQFTVNGGTNSTSRAVMVLDLWAGEEEAPK